MYKFKTVVKAKNTIMLSSFEAFAGRTQNRSQLLVEKILENWSEQGELYLEHVVLPVEFEKAAERLRDAYQKAENEVLMVVSFGECPDKEIRFEKKAENAQHSPVLADNAGKRIEQKTLILEDAPPFLLLDTSYFEAAKQETLSSSWRGSESVGLYVCNDLAFRSQLYFADKKIRYAFIHVPHLDVAGAPQTEDMALDLIKLLKRTAV